VNPRDADAIAIPHRRNVAATTRHPTDNLVTRNDRIPRGAQTALGDIQVSPAHRADIYSNQDFVRGRVRRKRLGESQYSAPLDDSHRPIEEHCVHQSRDGRWVMM